MEDFGGKMKNSLKNRNFWYTAFFLFLFSFVIFFGKNLARAADVPSVVTYQGKLLINGSAATTTQSMKFVLYDSLSGGTALYTASGTLPTTSTIGVSVSNGIFTVNFGDTGTNSLSPTIFRDNSSVYLEVTIGGETLSPRKLLTSAPFAFNSKYLNGVSATATPQSSAYIPVADGNGNFDFKNVTSTALTVSGETNLATTTLTVLNLSSINGTDLNFINGAVLYLTSSGTASLTDVSVLGNLSVTGNSSFGTIASGTWNGNAISNVYGGTGQNSSGWTGFVKVTGGTWSTSTISTSDLSDSASLVLLSGNNVFTGTNNFNATSTFATTSFNGYVGIGTTTPQSKLHIYDGTLLVDSPVNPVLAGSTTTAYSSGRNVKISGKYAYVGSANGLSIMDISQKNNPKPVSSVAAISEDLFVVGNLVYSLDGGSSSLVITDVSDPSNPQIINTFVDGENLLANARSIYVSGKYAYIVSGGASNSFTVIDISNPKNPSIVGRIVDGVNLSNVMQIFVSGNYGYAVNFGGGMSIIDISNPHAPSIVSFSNPAEFSSVRSVYVSGKYAYLSTGSDLIAVDVSNPASPTTTGQVLLNSSGYGSVGLFVSGKYAYVNLYQDQFKIVDISNPQSLSVVGTYNFDVNTIPYGVPYVSGKYAYVVGSNDQKLYILDLKGADISTADIGNINSSALTVSENVNIGNNLYIRNGLNIGQGGLLSSGALAISVSSTISTNTIFSAGTNTTSSILAVNADGTISINGAITSGDWNGSVISSTYGGTGQNSSAWTGFVKVVAGLWTTTTLSVGDLSDSSTLLYLDAGNLNVPGNITAGANSTIGSSSGNLTVVSDDNINITARTSSFSGLISTDSGIFNSTVARDGINRVINPSFESSPATSSWTLTSSSTEATYSVTTSAYHRSSAIKLESGNDGFETLEQNVLNAPTITTTITASFYSKTVTSSSKLRLYLTSDECDTNSKFYYNFNAQSWDCVYYVDNSLQISGTNYFYDISPSTTFNRSSVSFLPLDPDNYGTFNIGFAVGGDAAYYNQSVIVDAVQVELNTSPTIFDADTGSAFVLNAGNFASSTAGDKLLSLRNNDTEKLSVSANGDLVLSGSVTLSGSGSISTSGTAIFGTTTVSSLYANGTFVNEGRASNPLHKGSLSNGSGGSLLDGPFGVFVSGNYAYVISNVSNALEIVDVSNPASPTHKGSLTNGTGGAFLKDPRSIFVSGNYAYIASYVSNTLEIVDVSNPASPTHKGSLSDGVGGALLSSPESVVVSGNYAYVSSYGSNALEIVDISNPSHPKHVSSLSVNQIRKAQVYGNYVYALYYNSGEKLIAIDVSDPTNPVLKDDVLTFTFVPQSYLYVSGHYAYAGGFEGVLKIYDISNPNNLVNVGTSSGVGSIQGIYVSGNYAYVLSYTTNRFSIFDVSNPTSPVSKGYITNGSGGALLNNPWGPYISGNYAYVASSLSDALEIIDVSGSTISNSEIGTAKISNLSVIGSTDLQGNVSIEGGLNVGVSGLLLNGNFGMSSASTNTFSFSTTTLFESSATTTVTNAFIFDAANFDGTSSKSLLSVRAGNVEKFSVLDNGNIGIGTSTPAEKLHIYDGTLLVDNPVNPTLAGAVTFSSSPDGKSVYVSGNYAYAVTSDGLVAIDIKDKENPTEVGSVGISGVSTAYANKSLAIAGNYAYVVANTDNTLNIVDISNPASMSVVGTVASSSYTLGLESVYVSGKYAYILGTTNKILSVVDISDPTNPSIVGSVSDATKFSSAQGIYVSGKYAYVTGYANNYLSVVDISNPLSPTIVGSTENSTFLNGARSVYVSGKYAYVASSFSNSLAIVDVSNPTAPTTTGYIIDNTNLSDSFSVYVSGKYAYVVSNGGDQLTVVDVSSSTNPIFVGGYTGSEINGPTAVYVSGKYAYVVSANSNNLAIIDLKGADISGADVGSISSNVLTVWDNLDVGNDINIRNSLNVGSSFLLNGDFGMSGAVTNTLSFSTTTVFRNSASSSVTNTFVFDSINTPTSSSQILLSVRAGGNPVFSVAANGTVQTIGFIRASNATISTPGTPGDLAEKVDISLDESVEPGDVVVVDPEQIDTYRRSSGAYSETVAGVISTNPTIVVGDGKTSNTALMAMVGRVPIKVSDENGSIKKGDLLVTASLPGYAMRYDSAKEADVRNMSVVGLALEDLTSGATGKIMGLVRTGWLNNSANAITAIKSDLQKLATAQGVNLGSSQNLNIQNIGGNLTYSGGDLNLQGNQLLNVASIVGNNNKWLIDEQGRFITRVSTSAGDKDMYAMQSPNSEFVFSSSSQMISGEVQIIFDQYVQEVIDQQQPIKINITLTSGEGKGIYVSEKSSQGFTVKELDGGHSNATFDWIVVATRKPADQSVVPEILNNIINSDQNNSSGPDLNLNSDSSASTTVQTDSTSTPDTSNTTSNPPVENPTPAPESVAPVSEPVPDVNIAPSAEPTPDAPAPVSSETP